MLESSLKNSKLSILNKTISHYQIQEHLISVLQKEADALLLVIKDFPQQAILLVEKILECGGRVVFSGIGKSGLIARKIVATFSSMGIASFFLHPAEALHGDLGMLQPNDLFIAISKSGSGIELKQILSILSSLGNKSALICCERGELVDFVELAVKLPFTKEACNFNLAPTSSSTLTLAFGDALAIAVSNLRGFAKEDFAKNHPAGTLGKNLLLRVQSLMKKDDELSFISFDTPFKDLIVLITQKKLGVGIVVDEKNYLLGVITDGDLRRACNLGAAVFEKTASQIMTLNPKTINFDALAYDVLVKMEDYNITSLVVLENNKVVGLIHIHDLIKAGIRR